MPIYNRCVCDDDALTSRAMCVAMFLFKNETTEWEIHLYNGLCIAGHANMLCELHTIFLFYINVEHCWRCIRYGTTNASGSFSFFFRAFWVWMEIENIYTNVYMFPVCMYICGISEHCIHIHTQRVAYTFQFFPYIYIFALSHTQIFLLEIVFCRFICVFSSFLNLKRYSHTNDFAGICICVLLKSCLLYSSFFSYIWHIAIPHRNTLVLMQKFCYVYHIYFDMCLGQGKSMF